MIFMWIAHYNDGTELKQFSEGREMLFKDIELDKLKTFEIRKGDQSYTVNLEDGSFDINGQRLMFENFGTQNDFQLIYYVRVKRNIGPHLPPIERQICFGWKTNIDGYSFKRILKISDSGVVLSLK